LLDEAAHGPEITPHFANLGPIRSRCFPSYGCVFMGIAIDSLLEYSPDQEKALDSIIEFLNTGKPGIFRLTGAAGVGKSHITEEILTQLDEDNEPYICTALTNAAAAVLKALTGRKTHTLASALGLTLTVDGNTGEEKLSKKDNGSCKIPREGVLLVDEASMLGREYMPHLQSAMNDLRLRVLLIGDPYQLPPVGETSCVFDWVEGLSANLTTVHRQSAGSPIISQAHQLRAWQDEPVEPVPALFTELTNHGKHGVIVASRAEFQALQEKHYSESPNDCLTVAWTNRVVKASLGKLRPIILGPKARENPFLPGEHVQANQSIVNPDNGDVIAHTSQRFKITTVRESYSHGISTWKIETDKPVLRLQVSQSESELKTLLNRLANTAKASPSTSRWKAWKEFWFTKRSFADLRNVCASTVHKSQGCTRRIVFIEQPDIRRNPNKMEVAKLLYVATTRASNLVVTMGTRA